MLRAQHCKVVSLIMRDSFAFVYLSPRKTPDHQYNIGSTPHLAPMESIATSVGRSVIHTTEFADPVF